MCLGLPGQITEILDAEKRLALAEFEGVRRKVNIACVLEPGQNARDLVGAWVLVHVGFAMSVIDDAQARETLAMLRQLGEMQDELATMQASAAR